MIKITRKEADYINEAYREWKYDKATVISSAVSYKIKGVKSRETALTSMCSALSHLDLVTLVSVLDGNFIIEEGNK